MMTLMKNGIKIFFDNIIKVKSYKKILDAARAKKADKSLELEQMIWFGFN